MSAGDEGRAGRTVLVASADRLFAEAAAAYLRRDGWSVVGTAGDGLQALAAVGRHSPAAVLMIRELPRLGAAALARQVRRRFGPTTMVLIGEADAPDAAVLPPDANAAAVVAALSAAPGEAPAPAPEAPAAGLARLRSLTPRERRLLQLLADGLTMREIAEEFGASKHTVRTHMQNLYRKLECHSRLEVVRFAARHGVIETAPD